MLQTPDPLASLKVIETYINSQLQITTDDWDATLGGHTLLGTSRDQEPLPHILRVVAFLVCSFRYSAF
jgi:hypothetical protein